MIYYQDFVPRQLQPAGFFKSAHYGTLDEALAVANAWIAQHRVKVINVETVVLPNIHVAGEEGSTDPELRTWGELSSHWHQFIRLWYEAA